MGFWKELFCPHDYKAVHVKHVTITPVRYEDEYRGTGRYELPSRDETEVLYICPKCRKQYIRRLDGVWNITAEKINEVFEIISK